MVCVALYVGALRRVVVYYYLWHAQAPTSDVWWRGCRCVLIAVRRYDDTAAATTAKCLACGGKPYRSMFTVIDQGDCYLAPPLITKGLLSITKVR
jgi:hypothetical protein